MNSSSLQIAVCGGGACGLAVLLALLEAARKGKPVRSIYIFEKHSQVGPGLAYSESSGRSIINMRADTMGLSASDPLQFSRWLKSRHPELASSQYPSRRLYGKYLTSLFNAAIPECTFQGISVEVLYQELVDVIPKGDLFELIGEQGRTLTVNKVVLALGNFAACSQQHLTEKTGYISNPWCFQELDIIPANLPVVSVGSRLSGIDAALHLADNGHEGPLYLVSRDGRLPKVQGGDPARPFRDQHALYVLARDLEESDPLPGHRHRIFENFKLFAENLGVEDWLEFLHKNDPLQQISRDIWESEKGLAHWRLLADSASPILERLWRSLTPKDQKDFMNDWGSLCYSYVHAMPLENAQRLQKLLAEGGLQVSEMNGITSDEHGFTITLPGQQIHAEYLIEASGLDFRPSNIDSPVIKSLLSSNVLEEHHAAGFSVDQYTLESTTTRGLYVIGSLTTGVHFYTNGIDVNAKHASRIARHLVGEPVYPQVHVGLILPEHSESWIEIIQKAAPAMSNNDLIPFIYLSKGQPELDECHVRRPSAAVPSSSNSGIGLGTHDIPSRTLDVLAEQFGISVHLCDVSDPSFLVML